MKVHYKRSGGFANIVREVEMDSSALPENLQRLINSLQSSTAVEPTRSDDFFHELRLEDGRVIRCTDSQCSPALLELFDALLAP